MSCERALSFGHWKRFSKINYKPNFLNQNLLSLVTFLRVHSKSKEVSYLPWQNTCSNLWTTCHIKLKFFLWTKLLENLLLAKYLISVAAPLSKYFLTLLEHTIFSFCKTLVQTDSVSLSFHGVKNLLAIVW